MTKIVLLMGIILSFSIAEIGITGQNSLITSVDSITGDEPSLYFDDYFDLSVAIHSFTIDLGFEAHIPPFPGSFAPKDTVGFLSRSVSYKHEALRFTAGTFFTTLGNGITFRAYEERDFGWNTNVEGVRFQFSSKIVEGEFFGGKMRDTYGTRYELLEGGSLRFMPGDVFYPGLTAVTTKIDDSLHYWGSLTGELYLPFGQLKGEFAAFDFGKSGSGVTFDNFINDRNSLFNYGRAAYLNSTIYLGVMSLFLEGKNYKSFELSDQSLTYNSPPTVVRDHLFSLFSDMTPDGFKGGDEKGFLSELSGPLPMDNIFTISYSNSRSEAENSLLFEEFYGQVDITIGETKTIVAGGFQRDQAGQYVQGAINGERRFGEIALKGEFSHQHRTLNRNFDPARKFFYQNFELGVGWREITVSAIGAATSDPDKGSGENLYTKGWLGGQLDMRLKERHNLSLFWGSRKDGKICAGGVCVKKPELRGVELSITSSFF